LGGRGVFFLCWFRETKPPDNETQTSRGKVGEITKKKKRKKSQAPGKKKKKKTERGPGGGGAKKRKKNNPVFKGCCFLFVVVCFVVCGLFLFWGWPWSGGIANHLKWEGRTLGAGGEKTNGGVLCIKRLKIGNKGNHLKMGGFLWLL